MTSLMDLVPPGLRDIGEGLYFDRKGRPINMWIAAELKYRPGSPYERVGDTYLTGRLGPASISTVWLGSNHSFRRDTPPLIFETMIFCDDEDWNLSCWRYATKREAEIGHRQIVRLVKLLQREPRNLVKPHKNRGRHWR